MALEDEVEEVISELGSAFSDPYLTGKVVKVLKDLLEENIKQHEALVDIYYLFMGVEDLDEEEIFEKLKSLIMDNENRN